MTEKEFNEIWNMVHTQTEEDLIKEAEESNTSVWDLKLVYNVMYEQLKPYLVDTKDG